MARKQYAIKEMFYSLQGEGFHSGRPAVFLRFSGCNLWSGLEKDRATAICKFCDTDFWGTDGNEGGKFNAAEIAQKVRGLWPKNDKNRGYVVCTGGEPLLQLDATLIAALKAENLEIAIETNGTLPVPAGIDWVCVSPKANTEIVVTVGQELKLVFPQAGAAPEQYEPFKFEHYFLQPMDSPQKEQNTKAALGYCLAHPKWKLSLQVHKLLEIQ